MFAMGGRRQSLTLKSELALARSRRTKSAWSTRYVLYAEAAAPAVAAEPSVGVEKEATSGSAAGETNAAPPVKDTEDDDDIYADIAGADLTSPKNYCMRLILGLTSRVCTTSNSCALAIPLTQIST